MCTKWITEQLSRAKNAPLEIELLGNPTPETISLFPPHLHHTRELRLCGLSRSHFGAIKEFFALEAPDLEHLELVISVSKVTNPLACQDFDGAWLFRGKAPKLRTLSLCHIRVPWSLFPCCQFTQLKIVLSGEERNESPSLGSLDQLVDVLANCPNLEVLALECCLPSILSQSIPMRNVHLPHLSYLSLAGSIPRVVRFFEFLNLPSSTKLNLHCVIDDPFGKEGSLLIPLVFSHFNRPTFVTFRSFKAVLNHLDRSLEINASSTAPLSPTSPSGVFDNDGPDGNLTELSLSFITHSEFRQLEDILERACSVLPIAELKFLSVAAPDLSHSLNWEELFQKCEKITTLEASGHGTTSLLQAITPSKIPPKPPNNSKGKKRRRGKKDVPSQAADTTPPACPPIFPELKSLLLKGFDFSELVPQIGNVYDVLLIAIQRRKNRKKPLRMLSIDRSILCQRHATALEKLVREFYWSGEEAMSFEDYDFDDFDHYSSDYYDHDFHGHVYHGDDMPRLEDYFNGTTQAEWEWFENYSDGY